MTGVGLGRYSAELVVPAPVVAEVTLLKSVAVLYVMDEKRHLANGRTGSATGSSGSPGTWRPGRRGRLDPVFRDVVALRRTVILPGCASIVDQVASLHGVAAGAGRPGGVRRSARPGVRVPPAQSSASGMEQKDA
jgi:hypothetical protein